jgi:aryl-alcohol dehydrogenase-like predicted oxidoreductase
MEGEINLKYRRLGQTSLKVSVIGVGTWQYGGEWGKSFSQQEVNAILDEAKEWGINLIDTAECYGDHLSESLIGGYIHQGQRDDWVIATKFGHHFCENFTRDQQWSAAEILTQLEDSLHALRTDYVDIYQFHSGTDAAFDNDELWTALDKQIQAGKIRHLGISVQSNDNVYQIDQSAKVNASVIQVIYNRLDRKPEERLFPSCERQDLGVLARVPLASGYLSGKYKPGASFAEDDVRNRFDREEQLQKLRQVEQIQLNEVPQGMDMATWALAWGLNHPAVTSVIPGCKNPDQVISNAKAADYLDDNHAQAWKNN